MNFIEGSIKSAAFEGPDVRLPAQGLPDSATATMGFRPEDAQVVAAGQGVFDATVFTVEMTGDQTLVTFRFGDQPVVVKAPKDFDISSSSVAGIDFDVTGACFFDTSTGARLRA